MSMILPKTAHLKNAFTTKLFKPFTTSYRIYYSPHGIIIEVGHSVSFWEAAISKSCEIAAKIN